MVNHLNVLWFNKITDTIYNTKEHFQLDNTSAQNSAKYNKAAQHNALLQLMNIYPNWNEINYLKVNEIE